MAGPHTLAETENLVQSRLSDMQLDFQAMAVTSNLFRAANAVRNHLERTVLAPADLTWTAFVVLWVAWIWQTAETRMIAEESGVSKATLSGVLSTLEGRGLVTRRRGETDGRLVIVELTPAGKRLMKRLFPKFNEQEQAVCSLIPADQQELAAQFLRSFVRATS